MNPVLIGTNHYVLQARPGDGLALIRSRYGVQLWTRGTVPQRKHENCQGCERDLKGDLSYRPVTNLSNRMHRICRQCIENQPPESDQD